MGRLFEEYGNYVVAAFISIIVISLLVFIINANTLLGVKTEVTGDIECEMPEYPYTFEVQNANITDGDFDWHDYVIAFDENSNNLLDHVVSTGYVNPTVSGLYIVGYTFYYRGYSQTLYGLYTVTYSSSS